MKIYLEGCDGVGVWGVTGVVCGTSPEMNLRMSSLSILPSRPVPATCFNGI